MSIEMVVFDGRSRTARRSTPSLTRRRHVDLGLVATQGCPAACR